MALFDFLKEPTPESYRFLGQDYSGLPSEELENLRRFLVFGRKTGRFGADVFDEVDEINNLLGLRARAGERMEGFRQDPTFSEPAPILTDVAASQESAFTPSLLAMRPVVADESRDVAPTTFSSAPAVSQKVASEQPGLFSRIGRGLTSEGGLLSGSPTAQARLAAIGESLLGGPTRTPVSFGQALAQASRAGRGAELAQQQREVAELGLESKRRKLQAEKTLQEGIKEDNTAKISQAMLAIAPVQYMKLLQDKPTLSEEFKQYLDKNPELKTQYFEKKIQGGDLLSQFLIRMLGDDESNQGDETEIDETQGGVDLSELTDEQLKAIAGVKDQ
ncbi:hypothetical protein N9W09_00595 [Crocinitomicaceae bacterium]|nr:hypothetical protein [Crocinitomicaceae bacterium]